MGGSTVVLACEELGGTVLIEHRDFHVDRR